MSVTKTTTTSYFQRLGNSFKGILTGVILVILGICLIWWNEKRTVYRAKALDTGRKDVIEGVYDALNSGDEGKLVHISGSVKTDDILSDDVFHVSVNGFALTRSVEMYQWEETTEKSSKDKLGGSEETVTTYKYKKDWAASRIDSSNFEEEGHDNPQMAYESQLWYAENAVFGAHKLTGSQLKRIGGAKSLHVAELPEVKEAVAGIQGAASAAADATKAEIARLQKELDAAETVQAQIAEEQANGAESVDAAKAAEVAKTAETLKAELAKLQQTANVAPDVANTGLFGIPSLQIYKDGFYIGKEPAKPEIGDLRISFSYVASPADISVVCQQAGETFASYVTKTGNLDEMAAGIVPAENMFASAEKSNKFIAWLLRLVGFILISSGIRKVLDPLATLGMVLPFLGHIVGAGLSFVSWLLGAILSLVVIAIAWIFYRPVLACCLLAACVALVVLLVKRGGAKQA